MSEDLVPQLLDAIYHARPRVYRVGQPTPLERLQLGDKHAEVWAKREDLGPIKAYKWRGAYNALASLPAADRSKGVVAASAGNHAQGVALAARLLRCDARIYMPLPTPQVKLDAVRRHGGNRVTIVLSGDSFSETQKAALDYAQDSGTTFIPPYNDLTVMAGQGTVADEVVMSGQSPFDRVYVAIGGGGLAAATASLLKSYWPEIEVIGVEGIDQASMSAAFAAGAPTPLDYVDIFCDGTAVTQVGDLTYEICRSQIDRIITVTNADVCTAIKTHWDTQRVIPEPSGAMSLAGYLKEHHAGEVGSTERVLTILCGANMDFAKVAEISRQAGITPSRHRRWRFTIPEQRGSLVTLLSQLPKATNIIDLQYGRTAGIEQHPQLTLDIPESSEVNFLNWVETREENARDVTDDPASRYRVIPFTPALYQCPLFIEVEFPERAGALLAFMQEVSDQASLCYFTYTYSGERIGRALLGLDFADDATRTAARERLTTNPTSGVRHTRIIDGLL